MILIGVTGYKRCGKGSTARILVERYGFKEYGFADALRAMALAIDPLISLRGATVEAHAKTLWVDSTRYSRILAVMSYEEAKEIPDFRRYLQRLGTEGVRGTFGEDAWPRALGERFAREQPERAVVSDVRFFSEARWIHSRGGVIWRVNR